MTEYHRSGCPIASTLDLVGDRWSLVVVRDMLNGKSRFGEFLESPEGIPTNILTERLRRLESDGLIDKQPYQTRPLRHEYILTDRGRALLPILQSMCRFGNKQIPGTWTPPREFMRRRS